MKLQSLIIYLAIISMINCQESKRCFEKMTLGTSEISFINSIKDSIINKETFDASCLHILIERGYYKAAILLFEDYFLTNNIDLHETTLTLTAAQKRDLQKFIQKIMSSNQAVQQIEPVVKWAQSEDNIFLHMKLSMRADSPACLHCKVEKIEITNSTLLMSAYGIQSHQPLRFYLNLTLFDEINPDLSTWNEDSVGTLFFNLTKVHKITIPDNVIQPLNVTSQENTIQDQQNDSTQASTDSSGPTEEQKQEEDQEQIQKSGEQQTDQKEQDITSTQTSEQQQDTPKEGEQNKQVPNENSKEQQAEQPKQSTTTNNDKDSISKKIWLRLEKNERKKDIAIWWDMRDKYRQAMDEWDKLCTKERENKKKRAKHTQLHQEKSSTQQQNNQQTQQQQSNTNTATDSIPTDTQPVPDNKVDL